MAFHLVALDKLMRVRHMGIMETLHQTLAKLVMRSSGDQVKTACVNLYLCTVLDDVIKGATHNMG